MKSTFTNNQNDQNSSIISAQARLLMSDRRQKTHNRQQSMLQRAVTELETEV